MTVFTDMFTRGYKKIPYHCVAIYLSREKAIEVFKAFFDVDPLKSSCDCCGPDFSISESKESPDEEFFHLTPKKFKERCPWEDWP